MTDHRPSDMERNLGHNFAGPGNECFYCGYEKDEVIRYWLDCDKLQQLETRKVLSDTNATLRSGLEIIAKCIEL